MPAQGDSGALSRIPAKRKGGCAMNVLRDPRALTEAALAVALAFVLGLIRVWKMPFGGSISLEMVPLILLALAIDPFVVHPVQVLLDYPLAFGVLGLAGFFRPPVRGAILGTVVAVLARFLCHFLSGVVFFASYAPEGWNPFVYSAAYNLAYLVPSLIIALVVVVVLLRALEGAQPSPRQ